MASPSYERSLLWVVVAIVVVGLLDGESFAEVALVLCIERHGRVFRVPRNEDFPSLARHHHRDAALLPLSNDGEFGHPEDVFLSDFRMAAVRHIEDVVEAPEDGHSRHERHLREDAELLLRQRVLRNAVIVVEPCLGSPADV